MSRLAINLRHSRERDPASIVADGAIMTQGVADGKLVPVIILDTSERSDVEEVTTAHEQLLSAGDVKTAWLRQSWRNRSELRLMLHFLQPVECVVIVAFPLAKYAAFVDQIVHNEALYLQPGRPGDRLKNTFHNPKVFVEIDCEQFRPTWNRIFEREAAKELRRRGMRRREAKAATPELIQEMREFTLRRMGEYSAENTE